MPINGQLYAALAEEACVESRRGDLLLRDAAGVRTKGDGWQVETIGKGIRRKIACRQLIDCTGGADIVGMLGLPRLREAETQPGTLMFSFGGYDASKLNADEIEERYQHALLDGSMKEGDYCHADWPFINFLRGGGANAQHIFGADSSTSATKTQANIAGRTSVLRLLRFIRSLPGCANARITRMQQETAVRRNVSHRRRGADHPRRLRQRAASSTMRSGIHSIRSTCTTSRRETRATGARRRAHDPPPSPGRRKEAAISWPPAAASAATGWRIRRSACRPPRADSIAIARIPGCIRDSTDEFPGIRPGASIKRATLCWRAEWNERLPVMAAGVRKNLPNRP